MTVADQRGECDIYMQLAAVDIAALSDGEVDALFAACLGTEEICTDEASSMIDEIEGECVRELDVLMDEMMRVMRVG